MNSQNTFGRTRVTRWLIRARLDRSSAQVLATSAVLFVVAFRLALWGRFGDTATLFSFTLALLVVAVAGHPGSVALAAGQSIAAADTVRWLNNASDLSGAELIFFAVAVLLIMFLTEVIQAGRRTVDRAEEAVVGRDVQLRSVLDMFPDATMISATDGTIVSFNAAAVGQFGYAKEEVIGEHLGMLMPQLFSAEYNSDGKYMHRLLIGEEIGTGTNRVIFGKRKDGSFFPVQITGGEMRSGGERFLSIIRDLTEREEAAAKLEQIEVESAGMADLNQLDELASVLAHELNQPLSAITNYSHGCTSLLLDMDDAALLPIRQALAAIGSQSLRAGQIVNRLKDLRIHGETQKAPEDAVKLMEEALELGLIGSEKADLTVLYGYQPGIFREVMVDRVLVQQVIVNLVGNAIEAMRHVEHRELAVIILRADPDEVAVVIRDTGGGISEDVAGNLFEPFATTKASGRGMGLTISKRIVEAHGTKITVSRNGPGGTTFRFTLPAHGHERINENG